MISKMSVFLIEFISDKCFKYKNSIHIKLWDVITGYINIITVMK